VKPILEHVVPRQKMGVFSDLARLEIEKLGQNPDPEGRPRRDGQNLGFGR
jgi:hypothetical protein